MRRVTGSVASIVFLILLLASSAPAQAAAPRIVVLDFAGDAEGKLREQVQNELARTHRVELVSRAELEPAVQAHMGFRSLHVELDVVKLVAPQLGLQSIITGKASETALDLAIQDAAGMLLATQRFALEHAALGPDEARQASEAILVASRVLPPPSATPLSPPAQAAVSAAQESARQHRREAVLLERSARAVQWIEAERAATAQREARIEKRMAAAAQHYHERMARRQAALEREAARGARREAVAIERRNQVLRELDALRDGGEKAQEKAPPERPPQMMLSRASLVP